jgi:hypothetical protein
MALSVVNGPISNFNPYTRDQAPLWQQLAYAFLGVGTAAQRATSQAKILDKADIKVRVKTTDNAAASSAVSLTARGVTFPAGSFRKIRWTSFATTDNDSWFQEWEQVVWGNDGTTPKLLGSPTLKSASGEINGTAVHYGLCKMHYPIVDGALGTINALHSTAGMSMDGIDSGNGVITHPIARATVGARVVSALFSADVETIGERREVQVASQATATTSTLSMATQNGTEAVGVPTDDGELQVTMFIIPPPSAALVMNSNAVELHVGFDATDDVYHDIAVYVGPADVHSRVAD